MKIYDPLDWYWLVAGNAAQVFSSAAGNYVPVSDPAYVEWLANDTAPTVIDMEGNLGEVLGLARTKPPTPPAMLDAYRTVLVHDAGFATLAGLFDHENRIRTQEGVPPLTFEDFQKQMMANMGRAENDDTKAKRNVAG
jgi:hypothetical protein